MHPDPYLDPGSGVLRNKLGITDADALAQAEADLTFARLVELGAGRIDGAYDLRHLQDFHAHIFGDVYEWAGELRTVNITRSHTFALAGFIEEAGAGVFEAIAGEAYLAGLARNEFVQRLGHHLAEINALHPFREGNGRAQRAFLAQLASEAGYRIAWDRLDPDLNAQASAESLTHGGPALVPMLDALVEEID